MTKYERISLIYLLVISTITTILSFAILNKKTSQLSKSIPVPTPGEPITKSIMETKILSASDSTKLAEELAAIRNELSKIRAAQRGQNQTLGTTDVEDFLQEENNLLTPLTTPTARLTPTLGSLTLRSLSNAEVHKERTNPSAIVGRIYYGEKYPYFEKQDNWYLLKQENFQGWINSSFVKEIN